LREQRVSILVLVEFGLKEKLQFISLLPEILVSILVLVEFGLKEVIRYIFILI